MSTLEEAYEQEYKFRSEYNETFVPKTQKVPAQSGDPVKYPDHYILGRNIEPISVIEDWHLNFNLGNALKYISRIDRKIDSIQDLEKAIWYLNRELTNRKSK